MNRGLFDNADFLAFVFKRVTQSIKIPLNDCLLGLKCHICLNFAVDHVSIDFLTSFEDLRNTDVFCFVKHHGRNDYIQGQRSSALLSIVELLCE